MSLEVSVEQFMKIALATNEVFKVSANLVRKCGWRTVKRGGEQK